MLLSLPARTKEGLARIPRAIVQSSQGAMLVFTEVRTPEGPLLQQWGTAFFLLLCAGNLKLPACGKALPGLPLLGKWLQESGVQHLQHAGVSQSL